jgi:hypothetical protein
MGQACPKEIIMPLKKVKTGEQPAKGAEVPNRLDGFSLFKGSPMVRITGNFMGGGFNLSKNKAKAVLELADKIRPFAMGEYDEQIKTLGEGETLKYEE